MKAAAAPACYAVDTNTKLTPAAVRAIAEATYMGEPILGIGRYASLHAANFAADLSPSELETITEAGLGCWLIQHVRYGVGSAQSPEGWSPSGQLGDFDGAFAHWYAHAIGYPAGAHVALDLEGVNPTTPPDATASYCDEWALQVQNKIGGLPAYSPLLYVGYSPGLSPQALWELPYFHLYCCDEAPHVLPHRGFVMRQVAMDIMIGGVKCDVNRIEAQDALGGRLIWCVA